MKKLLIMSILALSLSTVSCTEDGLGNTTEINGPQADTGGTGNIPVKPPPPCPECPG